MFETSVLNELYLNRTVSNLIICSISISPSYFLKVFFRVKASEVEEIVIEKWCNRWIDLLTSMLLFRRDLHCVRPLVLWGFRNIFQPNIGEDEINVLPSERKVPGNVPCEKSGPGYCIMLIKKVK